MVTRISNSPEETRALGAAFAADARPGLVLGLAGDLGAGKTEFVKGFAQALGVRQRVHSPTFTLVNEYRDGRLPLYHLDLYRLETAEQVLQAGLEDYLPARDGVTVVEWFDRINCDFPIADLCRVTFEAATEFERKISYDPPGA